MEKQLFDKDKFEELADRTPAFDYCKKCVEDNENDVNALFQLGECYYFGIGTDTDESEARKIFKRVIKLDPTNKQAKKYNREIIWGRIINSWFFSIGIWIFCFLIGFSWIFFDSCEIKPSPKNEFKNYQELADINPSNSEAWYELGKCYDNGYGKKEDDVLAFECFDRAVEYYSEESASRYFIDSIYNLALCYMEGKGTDVDFNKAYNLFNFLLSLDETHSNAWCKLAICNVAKNFSEEDYEKAKVSIFDGTLFEEKLFTILKDICPYAEYFIDSSLIFEEDFDASIEYFENAIKHNPNNKEALAYLMFEDGSDMNRYMQLAKNNPTVQDMFLLGLYLLDSDSKLDNIEGFNYLNESVKLDKKNDFAWYCLGDCYQYGTGTEINEKKAFKCYKEAIKLDDKCAEYWGLLASCYARGYGTEIDEKKCYKYCKKANELDVSNASYWYLLGGIYQSGFGTKIDEKKALECYKKANELDETNAVYWNNLGLCYDNGTGTEVDENKAFECYKKANELDETNAVYWYDVGLCYELGFGTEINENKAFECYKKANELDETNAVYWNNLGLCYENGIGTEVDGKKAFECYKKANELDETKAFYCFELGQCYRKGIGTEVDEKKAFEFYKKANELDNKNTVYWYYLGDCYINGVGTEVNKSKAKELLTKSLELDPDNEYSKSLLAECDE